MADIIADVGASNSNSYVTLVEANNYFDTRLHSLKWNEATDEDKTKALLQATKRLEREKYFGDRKSSSQKLSFPRVGLGYIDSILLDNIIPEQLKDAQCELAIFMLSNDITQKEVNTGSIKRTTMGDMSVEYLTDQTPSVSSFNELPEYIETLLEDLSKTVSSTNIVQIGR